MLLGQVEDTEDRRRRDPGEAAAARVRAGGAVAARNRDEHRRRSVLDVRRQRADLQPWLADGIINRDRNLRLQYLAGLGVNLYQSDVIYSQMLRTADYPQGLFIGSDGMLSALQQSMRQQHGR